MELYKILEWDSQFFGYPVARIEKGELTKSELESCLNELHSKDVKLVYWSSNLKEAEISMAKEAGGKLVDQKTIYHINLNGKNEPMLDSRIHSFPKGPAGDELIQLAIDAGIYSRFSADEQIGKNKFIELYTKWIEQSAQRVIAEDVLVSMEGEKITGMITLNEKDGIGNIGLIAVGEGQRGKGLGNALIKASIKWFIENGCNEATVVTQGFNEPACILYEKNGFTVSSSNPFFHFWL